MEREDLPRRPDDEVSHDGNRGGAHLIATESESKQNAPVAAAAAAPLNTNSLVIVRYLGIRGIGPGAFDFPQGLCTDEAYDPHQPPQQRAPIRELVVADCDNNRIQAFTPEDGHLLYEVGLDVEYDDELLTGPASVYLTAAGELLVADTEHDRLMAYFRNPSWASVPPGGLPSLSHSPRTLLTAVLNRDMSTLVADYVAPGSAQFAYAFGSHGSEAGQFDRPQSLCVSRDEVFVVCGDNRVQVFALMPPSAIPVTASGSDSSDSSSGVYSDDMYLVRSLQFSRSWSEGCPPGKYQCPASVAVAHGGSPDLDEVIVNENFRVQVFTRDGRFLRTFGIHGTAEDQLDFPCAVMVNGPELLVADGGSHRIAVFERATGRWLRNVMLPDETDPAGLAMCPATGTLFVSDAETDCVLVLQ